MRRLIALYVTLALPLVFGQQGLTSVPCTTSSTSCQSGASSVMAINNMYYCCGRGFSMNFINNVCSCTKTSEVFPCHTDPQTCSRADSFSTDGSGITRCCLPDTFMSSFGGFINGVYVNNCQCERPLNYSAVEFKRRMREWARRFSANMNAWGQQFSANMAAFSNNLQRSLGNMFNRLSFPFG